jgi:hypothetical protein
MGRCTLNVENHCSRLTQNIRVAIFDPYRTVATYIVRHFCHVRTERLKIFWFEFFYFFWFEIFFFCLAWNLSRIIYCCTSSSKLWQNNAKERKKERKKEKKNNKSKSNLSSCEDNEMLQQELDTRKLNFVRKYICSKTFYSIIICSNMFVRIVSNFYHIFVLLSNKIFKKLIWCLKITFMLVIFSISESFINCLGWGIGQEFCDEFLVESLPLKTNVKKGVKKY